MNNIRPNPNPRNEGTADMMNRLNFYDTSFTCLHFLMIDFDNDMQEMKRKKGLSAKNSNYIKSLQKIVQKYSLDGNLIEEYPSVMDAARAVGNPKISRVGIKRCYQGRQKSAYGYIWKLKIQEND